MEDATANPIELGTDFGPINSLAFSQDSVKLAAGSGDYKVWLWDMVDFSPISLSGPAGLVYTLAFSPDGRWLASGADDFTVGLWDLSSSDLSSAYTLLGTHNGPVFSVAFNPNGKLLVSAGNDSTPRVWNISVQTQEKVEEEISSFELVASLKRAYG